MPDVVVVGGGPAGLSAATWLARYRKHVLVVDSGEYRNRWVDHTHGYLGNDPVPPRDLLERARAQLGRYECATRHDGRVSSIAGKLGSFDVALEDGERLTTKRVVLATGVRDAFPKIDRFFEHYGADIFHCASCDGYEARDRDVVAIGWEPHVVDFALGLLDWAASVTVVTDGHEFQADDADRQRLRRYGIDVVEDSAVALEGERGAMRSVVLQGGEKVPCALAFFSIAHHPASDMAESLGCALTDERCIAIDTNGETTVPGVYAAGDVTPGRQLVSVAAAEGATVGIACALSLTPDRP